MVVAADHVGDPHVDVVHHHAEVVGGGAVRALDDEVVKFAVLELDMALDRVVEGHRAGHRVLEADDVGLVGGVLLVAVAAVAVVAGLLPALHLVLAQLFKALLGAPALVGLALVEELPYHLAVAVEALGLVVGALVPVELEPLHGLDDRVDGRLGRALAVRVLDAQHELAAAVAGVEPREQRRPGAAHV